MDYSIKEKCAFQKLKSMIPSCIGTIIDVTRAELAFGNLLLPKLKGELKHSDTDIVRRAVYSVSDIVHDPEITAQAIKFNVISEIQDLCRSKDILVRQGCALILETIAGQPLGREAVMNNPIAVHNLSLLVEDPEMSVRLKAALAVTRLAKVWMGADGLNSAGFVPLLLKRLLDEDFDIVSIHLETLKALLDRDVKEQALHLGGMQTFAHLIVNERADISSLAESCMALLAQHHYGKLLAVDYDILLLLEDGLHSEDPAIHTKATAAIMFITITTPSKNFAMDLNIIDRLVDLAHHSHNQELQINCIKALTNLAETPKGRTKLKEIHEGTIINIPICKDGCFESIKHHLETLLRVIRWKP